MSGDEDANLARLDDLTERIAAMEPYAVGDMQAFLSSLPVGELERLREVVAARNNTRRSK